MGNRSRRGAGTLLGRGVAAAATVAASLAWAADGDGGLSMTVDVSTGLRFENERPGGSSGELTSRLGFGLSSVTRDQALEFRVDGDLRLNRDDGTVLRPAASFAYSRASRSTELSFDAGYRQEAVAGSALDPDFPGSELVADDGVRRLTDLRLGLVTGKDARFGTEAQLGYRQRRFTDTADPDLIDSETRSASAALRFTVSPTLTLRLTGSYSRTDEDDAFDTSERSWRTGLAAVMAASPVWTVSANIGFGEVETRRDGVGPSVSDGLEFGIGGQRRMTNGSFSLSASHEVTAAGGRSTFSLGRSLELKDGSFEGSFGLVRFETGSVAPVAQLAYLRELPRGAAFEIGLGASADVNSDDENILRSQLSASFSQPITAVSSWSVSTSLARIDVVDGAGDDQMRAEIGLDYRHRLTTDWSLALGMEHQRSYEGGSEQDRRNVLSATLQRSFSFRP